jgi:diacylglycerol O-acyltransferase
MTLDQSLSPLDAAFLYVESDRTPMHMATVALFEAGPLEDGNGKVRIEELRRLISSRLDLVPKLRQKAHPGLMHEAPPVWMDDPTFDISQHVRCCRLPEPGTEQELGRLCGEMLAAPLDRSRPLWELIFVDGLSGHRIALVEKLHHSMADGLAAAELATVLLDLSPRTIAPRSPLNAQIGPTRQLHFVRLGLDQVRDVAHFNNATINDAVLTIVAGGLHELLERRGDLTADSELQALVPVGLENKKGRGLANKVSAYFVRLPVGVEDPVSVLREVSLDTKRNKARHQELAAGIFLQLLEPLPQSLLARGAGLIQHQPFFNLIVTNVPGPTIPLYVLGAKLLEAFPIVPLAGNQGLGVAALSYEGQLNLGVFSDPTICPDIEAFRYGARSTFRDLVESCGVGR